MNRGRNRQLRLDVRFYIVGVRGLPEIQIQASTPAQAKYRAFKLAREAGYYTGLRPFLDRVATVRQLRRVPA